MASIRAHTTASGTTTHPQLGERMTNVEQAASGSETLTITDFLLARIAEELAVAESATGAPVFRGVRLFTEGHGCDVIVRSRAGWLAECEAKRRIVELHSGRVRAKENTPPHTVHLGGETYGDGAIELESHRLNIDASAAFIEEWYEPTPPDDTLRALALPYADHPDFREEWR